MRWKIHKMKGHCQISEKQDLSETSVVGSCVLLGASIDGNGRYVFV